MISVVCAFHQLPHTVAEHGHIPAEEPDNLVPEEQEPDDEELAQLAAERELLEGLDMDEIFSYSDVEDYPTQDEDIEMQ